ncbi:MAG: hypothetical protein SGILL_004112 [Bacillariaceae sp.]
MLASLARRPTILFGSQQEEYGERLPHHIRTRTENGAVGLDCFRDFLVTNARIVASSAKTPRQVSTIRDICCRMRKHFKVIQSQHFAKQIEGLSEEDLSSALTSLHRSGELCYFPLSSRGSHSDFVLLDPAWLVDSVDFVLRNGSRTSSSSKILTDQCGNECPSFRDEIATMWKNRLATQNGLDLAKQISEDAPDHLYGCITSLLIHHDLLVPLSFHKGPRDLFMPNTLSKRDYRDGWDSPFDINCPLLNLGHTGVFSSSTCHALTFMERVPSILLERVAIHIIKRLESCDYIASKVSIQEFHSWSDSFVLKLETSVDGEQRLLEVQSFLLHAREDDDAPSHSVCCKSMLITCMRDGKNGQRIASWKPVCVSLRQAMQKALNELPGTEYQDEGVCPECLRKKSVGEIGTWPFSKIETVLYDEETSLRCRNGHCVNIESLEDLISCELNRPPPDFSCCATQDIPCRAVASATATAVATPTVSSPKDELPEVESPKKLARSVSDEMPDLSKIKSCAPVTRSQTVPAMVESSRRSDSSEDSVDSTFEERIQLTTKAIQEYEASTKKRFFGMKKAKLKLDNLQLREKHLLPLVGLVDTPLGDNLQHLSLAGNLLETVPVSLVSSFPNLKSLDLSGCCIKKLPEKWNLPKLKKLNLSGNVLPVFPCEDMLVGVPELEELSLHSNRIRKITIPANRKALSKLKTLDLRKNKISVLPTNLNRLPSLKLFDVQHNPVKQVPVDIVSSMNDFMVEPVSSMNDFMVEPKGKACLFGRRGSSDDLSPKGKGIGGILTKQLSMTRDTQNTVPADELSTHFSTY